MKTIIGPKYDKRGVWLWSKIDGQWKIELYVACLTFSKMVKRPVTTIVKMMREGRLPALEIVTGPEGRFLCLTPLNRALKTYKAMQRSGRTWSIKR